jgi:hypothetical protein
MSNDTSITCEDVFLAGSDICGIGVPTQRSFLSSADASRSAGVYTRKWR